MPSWMQRLFSEAFVPAEKLPLSWTVITGRLCQDLVILSTQTVHFFQQLGVPSTQIQLWSVRKIWGIEIEGMTKSPESKIHCGG